MAKPVDDGLWPDEVDVAWLDNPSDAQGNMDMDLELGSQVAHGTRLPLVRIWRAGNQQGIGVSKRDVATERGRAAMVALMEEGCNVVVRQTGGTAVPHGEGVLHVSYLFPRSAESGTTDAYYRLLCGPLLAWLAQRGVAATTGALAGSYCDGTYNVLVKSRKLIGTAQAWKGGLAGIKSARPGYILAHACITVDVELEWAVERINRFYERVGDDYRVDTDTGVTLRTLCPEMFSGLTAAEANQHVATELMTFYREWVAARGY